MRMIATSMLVMGFHVLLWGQAPRPDVFVDAASGSNATGNGSAAAPWQTITHALTQVTAPVTINVAPGTYDAALGEVFPINVGPGITLAGAGASVTTVQEPAGMGTRVVFFQGQGYQPPDGIRGLTMSGGAVGLAAGDFPGSTGELVVQDCAMTGNGAGIVSLICLNLVRCKVSMNSVFGINASGNSAANARIVDCNISSNAGFGLDAVACLFMQGTTVDGNGGVGVDLDPLPGEVLLLGNRITNNGGEGIVMVQLGGVGIPDPVMASNLIADNGSHGVAIDMFSRIVRMRHNTVVNNAGGSVVVTTLFPPFTPPWVEFDMVNSIIWGNQVNVFPSGTLGTSIALWFPTPGSPPPGFVDPANGDYRLLPGSPCIDNGSLAVRGLPSLDADGNIHSYDGDGDGLPVPDQGAFELVPPNTAGLRPVGHGCDAGTGLPTLTGVGGLPAIGNGQFGLNIGGGHPSGVALLQLAGNLSPVEFQVPTPACVLWLDPANLLLPGTALALPLDAQGAFTLPVPLPNVPALQGTRVFAQALAADLATGAYGLTNGLEIVVQ